MTDFVIKLYLIEFLFQPIGAASMKDLFAQPHKSNESTKSAQNNNTTLQYVCWDIISVI